MSIFRIRGNSMTIFTVALVIFLVAVIIACLVVLAAHLDSREYDNGVVYYDSETTTIERKLL
jgi:hypothetical protein